MSNAITTTSNEPRTMGFLANATETFEGIEKLAALMGKMATMPAHLAGKPADCFRIVVQAAKWRMDPFAVAECTALVHGKMCYEGKLVAAVLQSMGAIEGRLQYDITGTGQAASIVVTGTPRGGKPCSVRGSVKDWRTTGANSPWDKQPETMLVYRGTRQWARLFAPEAVLGVYTPDEARDGETREIEGIVIDSQPAVDIGAARKPATAVTTAANQATTKPDAPAAVETGLSPTAPAAGDAALAAPVLLTIPPDGVVYEGWEPLKAAYDAAHKIDPDGATATVKMRMPLGMKWSQVPFAARAELIGKLEKVAGL